MKLDRPKIKTSLPDPKAGHCQQINAFEFFLPKIAVQLLNPQVTTAPRLSLCLTKILTLIFTTSVFALTNGCIHTKPREIKIVQTLPHDHFSRIETDCAQIQYFVFRPSKLPMNDFFFHLRKGDYNQAFHQLDLRYKSAIFSDEALNELVSAGLIPVYVNIQNQGLSDLQISESLFALDSSGMVHSALPIESLPQEFKHFSPGAVAANVYNTSLVVLAYAALLAAEVMSSSSTGLYFPDSSAFPAHGSIFNEINPVTQVNYQNYLIHQTVLKPGQEAKGLLFYNFTDSALSDNSKLVFSVK